MTFTYKLLLLCGLWWFETAAHFEVVVHSDKLKVSQCYLAKQTLRDLKLPDDGCSTVCAGFCDVIWKFVAWDEVFVSLLNETEKMCNLADYADTFACILKEMNNKTSQACSATTWQTLNSHILKEAGQAILPRTEQEVERLRCVRESDKEEEKPDVAGIVLRAVTSQALWIYLVVIAAAMTIAFICFAVIYLPNRRMQKTSLFDSIAPKPNVYLSPGMRVASGADNP